MQIPIGTAGLEPATSGHTRSPLYHLSYVPLPGLPRYAPVLRVWLTDSLCVFQCAGVTVKTKSATRLLHTGGRMGEESRWLKCLWLHSTL